MDGNEVTARVTEANRKIRIKWYEENALKWRDVFKANLTGMLQDPCWLEGELEEICLVHFKLGETEMRELAGLPFIPAVIPDPGEEFEKRRKAVKKAIKETDPDHIAECLSSGEHAGFHRHEEDKPPSDAKLTGHAEDSEQIGVMKCPHL